MGDTGREILHMVDLETRAWDTQDVDLLMSIFHPDMVWFWPPDNTSHDPASWESPLGRFDRDRWRKIYSEMFAEYKLVRNHRLTVEIKTTGEGGGALAIVDIDTLWEHKSTGERIRWSGRTGKTYSKVEGEWKMIAQTGALLY